MTLTEFLLARIAEDEVSERFVSQRHVGAGKIREDVTMIEPSAHVLAECEAKRQIVALHKPEPGQHPDFCGHDLRELPCPTLRALALPDADHPDYLPEWKP